MIGLILNAVAHCVRAWFSAEENEKQQDGPDRKIRRKMFESHRSPCEKQSWFLSQRTSYLQL